MSNCAVVGINWGDEGKGRMVDLLTQDYDVVVRFQGGGNAGHTIVNEYGKFALHLIPSGIFRENVVNILGPGVALDPENLYREVEMLRSKGVVITPDNLKISSRASLLAATSIFMAATAASRCTTGRSCALSPTPATAASSPLTATCCSSTADR